MTAALAINLLGRGIGMPVAPDDAGRLPRAAGPEKVRESIFIILDTEPGERVMRPDFGAGLRGLAFEPINTTTMALARHRVEQALIQWEPRIDTIGVMVTADPPRGKLNVDVHYRVRRTNTFYNLVYPFYLQEGRDMQGAQK